MSGLTKREGGCWQGVTPARGYRNLDDSLPVPPFQPGHTGLPWKSLPQPVVSMADNSLLAICVSTFHAAATINIITPDARYRCVNNARLKCTQIAAVHDT